MLTPLQRSLGVKRWLGGANIIHSDKDPISLESSQAIHETIADSQLAVFENVGHIPFVEEPDLFYATVRDFIQQITK